MSFCLTQAQSSWLGRRQRSPQNTGQSSRREACLRAGRDGRKLFRGIPKLVASSAKRGSEAVMRAAEQSGLLREKSSRIGGRVSSALVRQAKRQTGIETDTDLIEFALATVAREDNFAEAFKEARGRVDPELKL